MDLVTVAVISGVGALFVIAVISFAKFYRQVEQGKALIVNTLKAEPVVTFTGAVVLPIIHRAEVMDISVKTIEIDRRGKEGLICKDNIRADIKVTFFVRVNKTREDVLKVARRHRLRARLRPGDAGGALRGEVLRGAQDGRQALQLRGALHQARRDFKDQIIEVIGKDLNGYILDDCAIDYLEQTPIEMLDKDNILDAQGIRKITELTTMQNVSTNEFRQRRAHGDHQAERRGGRGHLRARAPARRGRGQAEARDREHPGPRAGRGRAREVRRSTPRPSSRASRPRKRSTSTSRTSTRQVEVAQKNRERVVGVETERVEKDRAARGHRPRARGGAAAHRQGEGARRREEGDRRRHPRAHRRRQDGRRGGGAHQGPARERRGHAPARTRCSSTPRRRRRRSSSRTSRPPRPATRWPSSRPRSGSPWPRRSSRPPTRRPRRRCGSPRASRPRRPPPGLAEVRVREADAVATEKQGLAQVRVKEAEAARHREAGPGPGQRPSASGCWPRPPVSRRRVMRAQAPACSEGRGRRRRRRSGAAEGRGHSPRRRARPRPSAIQEKLLAEAQGLAEKADAMKALDGVGREHEEFRLRLEKERDVELETIRVRKDIAAVPGPGARRGVQPTRRSTSSAATAQFFDRFVKAVSLGTVGGRRARPQRGADARRSSRYLTGEKDLAADLKEILSKPGLTNDAQNLAVAALLHRIASNAGAPQRRSRRWRRGQAG